MSIIYRNLFALMLVAAFVCGCAGASAPTQAPISPSQALTHETSVQSPGSDSQARHYLWSFQYIAIDPADPEGITFDVIPLREVVGHWNVASWLEQGPCTTCFKLVSLTPSGTGTLLADIQVKHPFPKANLTGFDVRGIAMFNASHAFPASGLTYSDRTAGDGAVVNPDGFTTLYNATTAGSGPNGLQGYLRGKLATATAPDGLLNAYKRFITDNPANIRNAFYAGDTVTVTYEIDMPDAPNPFVLGYAVDACWAPPTVKPVTDPMTDFGPEANCPEAWQISVSDTPVGAGLTDCAGQAKLTIDVYDWQGKDTAHPVLVECPELFDSEIEAVWTQDGADFTRYEAVVGNSLTAPAGTYKCLVSQEAAENDPSKPWLDLTVYQVCELDVIVETRNPPEALAEASKPMASVGEVISFDGSASHDNDCSGQSISTYEWDWESDGTYDEEGVSVDHSWDSPGTFYVQLRVTDDESETDVLDEPLEVAVLESGSLIWAKGVGAANYDYGKGVATLSDNSTVMTGLFHESATFGAGEPNETVLVSDGDYDVFVARYNSNGTLAWAKRAGGEGADLGQAVTALLDDSTVVTGHFYAPDATFGESEPNETVLVSDGDYDVFVARYNPDGTLAWAKRASGAGLDFGYGVTVLSDDSTIATGSFGANSDSATFGPGEPNETVLVSAGLCDVFIARYNPDGTLAWAKCAGGTGWDMGQGVTTLLGNSTVMTGYFNGSATFGDGEPNETVLVSSGSSDGFVARYNPDGTLVWAKRAGGAGADSGNAVTTLSGDSIVVTGRFEQSATFGPGEPNQTVLVSDGLYDVFVARYNPDGTLAWAKHPRGTGDHDDVGCGVTTLSDDTTVVTGYFYDSATFGEGEPNETVLVAGGGRGAFIAHYNGDGTLAWARGAAGTDWVEGWGITALSDNSTVVSGDFYGTAAFGEGEPNETVLVSAGLTDIFVARFYK